MFFFKISLAIVDLYISTYILASTCQFLLKKISPDVDWDYFQFIDQLEGVFISTMFADFSRYIIIRAFKLI